MTLSRFLQKHIGFLLIIMVLMGYFMFKAIIYLHQALDVNKSVHELYDLTFQLYETRIDNDYGGEYEKELLNQIKWKLNYQLNDRLLQDYECISLLHFMNLQTDRSFAIIQQYPFTVQQSKINQRHTRSISTSLNAAKRSLVQASASLASVSNHNFEERKFSIIYLSIGIILLFFGSLFLSGRSILNSIRADISLLSPEKTYNRQDLGIGVPRQRFIFKEFNEIDTRINAMDKDLSSTYDEIYHMASFPQLDPNPVLEVGFDKRVLYANNSAKLLMHHYGDYIFFPEDIDDVFKELQGQEIVSYIRREITIGKQIFELYIDKPYDINAVRIYSADITDRRKAEHRLLNTTRMYKLLSRVNHGIVYMHNAEELFKHICRSAVEDGAFSASFYAEMRNGKLHVVTSASLKNKGDIRFLADTVYQAHTATSTILCVYNQLTEETYAKHDCRSLAILPVRDRDEHIGWLTLLSEEENYFGSEEIQLLERIIVDAEYALKQYKHEQQRRTFEEQLHKSEMRYRSLFDKNKAVMLLIDPKDGKIVDVNDSACIFYGYTKDHMKSMTVYDIDTMAPEDITKEMSNAVVEQRDHFIFRHKLADNRIRDVEMYAGNIMIDDNIFLFSIVHDITDKLKAEAEIKQLNADLERRIAERTAELHAYAKELESFSFSVSHDLRAPLRSIAGFSKFLSEDFSSKLNEQGQDYLHRINSGVDKMNELIDNLLNLSRITRADLVAKPVNISIKAREIVDELKAENPGKKVEIIIEENMIVAGDERLLSIALQNLLNNALKYSSKKELSKISFMSKTDDGRKVYYIQDNGAGFDMRYADKLFGAFQRLHGGGDFPGTGIGLAIVQRIILRHGGRIWAEAEPDKGATFYFTIESKMESLAQ